MCAPARPADSFTSPIGVRSSMCREKRVAMWERLYYEPGFGIWLGNFRDIFTDEAANAEFSEFIAGKIRQRVHDPAIADKLIPKDHGFGVHRVPLESMYYEVYNRDNVHLIDLIETPIECIAETGIRTTEQEYEVDVIVFATGFDAITGAYDHIDIRGVGGQRLRDKWCDGPVTYFGLTVSGFPNLLTVAGPQSASASVNYPRGIETSVDWVTGLLKFMGKHGYSRLEAAPEVEEGWLAMVADAYNAMLLRKGTGWMSGYNSNVEGHELPRRRPLVYAGGAPKYRRLITEMAANDYEGLGFA